MSTTVGVQICGRTLIPPAIRPRPLHYRVPFYKLAKHTLPVKWSLYRGLLRAAPSVAHVRHIQQRWRLPSKRHQVSPSKTVAMLKQEYEWLDTYRQIRDNAGRVYTGEVQEAASRIAALDDVLHLQAGRETMEGLALDQYHAGLARTASRIKPVVTPSFIFPTLINPPLPRLKPQPLHITMPIYKRRSARNRRIVREQSWKEMLVHARQDQGFDASVGVSAEATTERFVKDALTDIRASNDRDFARLKLKFPKEMLKAANDSRRKRPTILGHIRRKTETARKLKDLYATVSEKD